MAKKNEKTLFYIITRVNKDELVDGTHFDKMEKWKNKMRKMNRKPYYFVVYFLVIMLVAISLFNPIVLNVVVVASIVAIFGVLFIMAFLFFVIAFGYIIGEEPTLEEIT